MKAVVAAFTKENVLVGAFSVITNFRVDLRSKLYCQAFCYLPTLSGGEHARPVPAYVRDKLLALQLNSSGAVEGVLSLSQ